MTRPDTSNRRMRADQAWSLVRHMGPAWIAFRTGYALRRRLGWLEWRCPTANWSSYELSRVAPAVTPALLMTRLRQQRLPFAAPTRSRVERLNLVVRPDAVAALLQEVEEACAGRLRLFSRHALDVSWPPKWHRHPQTGADWPRMHWSRLSDEGPDDVKWLWELGRFGLAFSLVRTYWLTGDVRCPEMFWQLVESWRRDNPPNYGVHWMSGQECAIRLVAWTFALFAMLEAPASTPGRVAALVEMIAAHGTRIERDLAYGLSQKNNHGINEALALWTAGALFPMLAAALRWEATGRRLLEREARRQIYPDGAYIQHSLNYHRLILQSYGWALALSTCLDRPFTPELRSRYLVAARFLYELTDDASGSAPNYGSNDGSVLLRLDSADHSDFRPTLALAFWVAERRRVFGEGPWDEPLLWLCGDEPLATQPEPLPRTGLASREGGYYTLRAGETWAFVRCCDYRDRPAQADMLHVDVWWRGVNVLADPGTYSYSSAPPWDNALAATSAHNTVAIDGLDQMERGSRFVWFHWNCGRLIRHEIAAADGDEIVTLLEGQHDGYVRRLGVTHRRVVIGAAGCVWVVVDDLLGPGVHQVCSHWLFRRAVVEEVTPSAMRLATPAGPIAASFFSFSESGARGDLRVAVVPPDVSATYGWFSPGYMHREPGLSIVTTDTRALPMRRVTILALGATARIEKVDTRHLALTTDRGRLLQVEWEVWPYDLDASLIRTIGLGPRQASSARLRLA